MDIQSRCLGNTVSIWGRAPALGTTLAELYVFNQALDWPTVFAAAAKLDIASSSTNDAAAGTGARTVRIVGLDGNYTPQVEDIALNGQTMITSAKSFLRVFGVEVLTAGSGGVNAGDVYFMKTGTGGTWTTGVPGTLTSGVSKILVGWGSCMNGIFTTPVGSSWALSHLILSSRAQAATIMIQSEDLSLATPRLITSAPPIEIPAGGSFDLWLDRPDATFAKGNLAASYGQKTDIRIRGFAAGASAIASVSMTLQRCT
jgi:hypothetical protein